MGRLLRRVPLDFDYPMKEVWKGYIITEDNPCRTDPPVGDGYQLWENTSEGSPISPVFDTLEELCEWCETNETVFGNFTASKEKWMQMLENNFVYHVENNIMMC